jgi:hypothetical protein
MKLRKQRVEEVNLAAVTLLESHAQRHALARVDPLGVIEHVRFIDVSVRATRWAKVLRQHGVAAGEHVVVLAERDRAWRAALLGVMEAGCVAVPYPGTAPDEEILAVASHWGAALILSAEPRPDLEDGPAVVSGDEVDIVRTSVESPPNSDGRRTLAEDAALVLYADHHPDARGAVHTHGSLVEHVQLGNRWLGLGPNERIWSTVEDGSAESIWLMLAAWHAGVEIIVIDQVAPPETVLELLARLQPAAIWLSDEEYGRLAGADVPHWIELPSIRRALSADAAAPGVTAFHEFFGTRIAPVLVSAEAGVVAGCPADSDDEVTSFRGDALTVLADDDRELRAGDVGDLAVAGDAASLFVGYGKERLEPPQPGTWFRIGRRGAIDPDGLLRLEPGETERPRARRDEGVAAHVATQLLGVEADERRRAEEEDARRRKRAERDRRDAERAETKRRADEARRTERQAVQEAKERVDAEERRRREEEKNRKNAEREQREAERNERKERARAVKEHAREEERLRTEAAERAKHDAALAGADERVLEEERRQSAALAESERTTDIVSRISHYGIAGSAGPASIDKDRATE